MEIIKCDFCAKNQDEVVVMYTSAISCGVAICSGCVAGMIQDLNDRALAFERSKKVRAEVSISVPQRIKTSIG